MALFGDMGNVNAQSLGRLQREAQEGMYDLILHVGDFAYDMDTVRVLRDRKAMKRRGRIGYMSSK